MKDCHTGAGARGSALPSALHMHRPLSHECAMICVAAGLRQVHKLSHAQCQMLQLGILQLRPRRERNAQPCSCLRTASCCAGHCMSGSSGIADGLHTLLLTLQSTTGHDGQAHARMVAGSAPPITCQQATMLPEGVVITLSRATRTCARNSVRYAEVLMPDCP